MVVTTSKSVTVPLLLSPGALGEVALPSTLKVGLIAKRAAVQTEERGQET